MLWPFILLVVFAAFYLFLIFPAHASPDKLKPFRHKAYAHRGLYTPDQSVPENSLPAFCRAAEAGFGAELDVQLTKDGRVVVLHDDDLERACGRKGAVCDYTFEELQAFPLFGTQERIPLFSDVLDVFGGRLPLIVELKSAAPNTPDLCEAVRKMLAVYPGPACVESFSPEVVRFFRLHDPERVRGQLSQAARSWKGRLSPVERYAASRLLLNFRARPQFIAYGIGPKPLPVRVCEALGAMKVCWTAREASMHARRMENNDAVIFEGYKP